MARFSRRRMFRENRKLNEPKPRGWPWLAAILTARHIGATTTDLRKAIEAGFLQEHRHFRRQRGRGAFAYLYNVVTIYEVWPVVKERLAARRRIGAKKFDRLTGQARDYGA